MFASLTPHRADTQPNEVITRPSLVSSLIRAASHDRRSVFLPDVSWTGQPIVSASSSDYFAAPPLAFNQLFSQVMSGSDEFVNMPAQFGLDKTGPLVEREPWLIQRPFEDALMFAMMHRVACDSFGQSGIIQNLL